MRYSEGATVTNMAPGAVSRLLILSLREAEVGKEYEGFTVTRALSKIWLNSTGAEAVVTAAMLVQHKDVTTGVVTPAVDPHADWLYHEEFVTNSSTQEPLTIWRDIRSQRKARGDMEVYMYLINRSGVITVEVHRSGSLLVKM